MLKSENVVVIHGWMCNELNLKGNELLVFALIYGFSCDGASTFFGGRRYISETFNISLPTVDKALKSLVDSEFIIKEAGDSTHTDTYYVNEGVVKKLYGGGKETLPNNIINNKKPIQKTISKDIVETDTKCSTDKNTKKKNLYQKCSDLVTNYTNNTELRVLLMECFSRFSENNRENGMPFYTNQFKGKLNTLSELATDATTQIKIVKQTLDNGWNNFYELKENKPRRRTGNVAHDIEHLYNGVNEKADKRCSDGEKF